MEHTQVLTRLSSLLRVEENLMLFATSRWVQHLLLARMQPGRASEFAAVVFIVVGMAASSMAGRYRTYQMEMKLLGSGTINVLCGLY